MLDDLATRGLLERNRPLGPLTTYKLGGPARFFAEVSDESSLLHVLEARRGDGGAAIRLLVLGRGSNLVIADAGFDGLVVRLGGEFVDISIDASGDVTAGAAVALPKLARAAVKRGRGGLEFFVGVPGSVGGAVHMNAGCHGSETAEWMISARILDADTATVSERSPEDLDHRYRHSNLRPTDIVLSALFGTNEQQPAVGERIMREVTQWRREHQPGGTLNAGSVFKNPESGAAGELIDRLGLKGFSVGGASVSDRHANFFVARVGTSAQDIFDLVHEVRRRVGEESGIWLEPEIKFAGSFERKDEQP